MEWVELKHWQPKTINEIVEGVLVNKREGDFGVVYDLECKDGIKAMPCLKVLNRELKRCKIGRQIKIQYLGEVDSKSGQKYKDFKVFVKKDE